MKFLIAFAIIAVATADLDVAQPKPIVLPAPETPYVKNHVGNGDQDSLDNWRVVNVVEPKVARSAIPIAVKDNPAEDMVRVANFAPAVMEAMQKLIPEETEKVLVVDNAPMFRPRPYERYPGRPYLRSPVKY